MTEVLPFRHYLPPHAKKLVLGSFPCFNGIDYGDFYYSGSGKNHFWQILSVITGMPAGNVSQKKAICDRHNIALSDVALKVRRRLNNCSDSNLEILEYNHKSINTCLEAGVTQVFFTSRFVERHFDKMYPGLAIGSSLLVSPSPAANRHIGGLAAYKAMLKKKVISNVFDYRVANYRSLLFS